jgi:tetratricopeptide (TPR) repeat protein
LYVIELIKSKGLPYVIGHLQLIVDFATDKSEKLLDSVVENGEDLLFFAVLAEFDCIKLDILDLVFPNYDYSKILEKCLSMSICEKIGAVGEYIHLCDIIRDYVQRLRITLTSQIRNALRAFVEKIITSQDYEGIDASTYFYSLRQTLINGDIGKIDDRYLIPSHFLNAMKDLYDNRKSYKDVISLANRVLAYESNLDKMIADEIRFYLCLSLARVHEISDREEQFKREIFKVDYPKHDFLFGFYYRMQGRYSEAIERQSKVIDEPRIGSMARRELVQIYILKEEYDKALSLAEENYTKRPNNPFHLQAYLICLMHREHWRENQELIEQLLEQLSNTNSEQLKDKYLTTMARYKLHCLNQLDSAEAYIDQALQSFPDILYPHLTKLDLMDKQGCDLDEIKSYETSIENTFRNDPRVRNKIKQRREKRGEI